VVKYKHWGQLVLLVQAIQHVFWRSRILGIMYHNYDCWSEN